MLRIFKKRSQMRNLRNKFLFQLKNKSFIYFVVLVIPGVSFSDEQCKNLFEGSLREAQSKAIDQEKGKDIVPKFQNPIEDIRRSKVWTGDTTLVNSLSAVFPKGISFIDHRLRESQREHLVKIPAEGSSLMARAEWPSQGKSLKTNITFSKMLTLPEHFESPNQWLFPPDTPAVIFYLHGGGTKSTGGHTAESLINHFFKFDIAVMSPDLPWHGEGPRVFMGNLDQEIQALADLAKKYIPPNVPVFIYGHSLGGSLAHRIMQMSDKKNAFASNNVQGIVIASPAVDSAPGQSLGKKKEEAFKRRTKAMQESDKVSVAERELFQQMLENDKTAASAQFYTSLILAQLDDTLPSHGGDDYTPSLMIVGEGDQLVFLAFEDLFHNYYDSLSNVEAHYLRKLPLLASSDKNQKEVVGHLLSDYVLPSHPDIPVNFKLMLDFISKTANIPIIKQIELEKRSNPGDQPRISQTLRSLNVLLHFWANDLSFREWAKQARITKIIKTNEYKAQYTKWAERKDRLNKVLIPPFSSKDRIKSLLYKFLNEEQSEDSLAKLKKQIKPYGSSFNTNQKGIINFFNSFEQDLTIKEHKDIAEKAREEGLFNLGKKELHSFVEVFLKQPKADILEKYPYITEEEIAVVLSEVQEINKQSEILAETYIPNTEDYEKAQHLHLTDKEIEERIGWIKENTEKRQALEEKRQALGKKAAQLKKQLQGNIRKVQTDIKYIKNLFTESSNDFPVDLKRDYEQNREEFLKLYELSKEMEDRLENDVFEALKQHRYDTDFFINEILSKHKKDIEEFEKRYKNYVNNRAELREKLKTAALKGELSKQAQEKATALLGRVGLYSETEMLSTRLAEAESQKIQTEKQRGQLIRDYNSWTPFDELSIVQNIKVIDILNIDNLNKGSVEQHKETLQAIIKAWQELNSEIPPSLPE